MSGRFDYVEYDDRAAESQRVFKLMFEEAEKQIAALPHGRAQALALTHMEEAYMWVGKAIRDDQIARSAKQ